MIDMNLRNLNCSIMCIETYLNPNHFIKNRSMLINLTYMPLQLVLFLVEMIKYKKSKMHLLIYYMALEKHCPARICKYQPITFVNRACRCCISANNWLAVNIRTICLFQIFLIWYSRNNRKMLLLVLHVVSKLH